ncbi:MAG: hypothetical protein M0R74_01035 [Dehalococcoidia bacterium]|nr:hypothetical protein [Dehalococcoidia bacterium]
MQIGNYRVVFSVLRAVLGEAPQGTFLHTTADGSEPPLTAAAVLQQQPTL